MHKHLYKHLHCIHLQVHTLTHTVIEHSIAVYIGAPAYNHNLFCAYVCVREFVCVYVCVCMFLCVYVIVCIFACVPECVCVCVCLCVFMYVWAHTLTRKRQKTTTERMTRFWNLSYTHLHIHTYIHTYAHTLNVHNIKFRTFWKWHTHKNYQIHKCINTKKTHTHTHTPFDSRRVQVHPFTSKVHKSLKSKSLSSPSLKCIPPNTRRRSSWGPFNDNIEWRQRAQGAFFS